MQTIEINRSDVYTFFCPVTGQQILFEDDFKPSPATIFHYLDFDNGFFPYANDWIKTLLTEQGVEFDDEMWVDVDDFNSLMEKLNTIEETENHICFAITETGMACGPVSSTGYICIDMCYKSKKNSVRTNE
ncbi:hypothetical protein K8354_13245 [Polaribacter litorisediminis]|uniref:hypothetical protein n=1 Tax=Polaribacter litorisediminis TaxID=1908341 RepID=UPI001CBF8A5B|nr:hypothetical protein [Polaribacter litorisediminis]UAM97279.1 hypothetical protein K8354_13245 [Polaribacter litorisediminis]